MYKASNARGAREEISALTPLERTNWLVPQLSAKYQSDFDAIQGHYGRSGRRLDKAAWKEARSNLIRGLQPSRLAVYSSGVNDLHSSV